MRGRSSQFTLHRNGLQSLLQKSQLPLSKSKLIGKEREHRQPLSILSVASTITLLGSTTSLILLRRAERGANYSFRHSMMGSLHLMSLLRSS